MRIVTVVGARPQFIKAAPLSRVLQATHTEILVHTGQHFDRNMSDVFFSELEIPAPAYNLGIAGGTHGQMTGRMLMAIEEVLVQEKPDMLLLYGDTNSTLAGALAAVKMHIPVAHVEAGNRFRTLKSPEEANRICTDHVSTLRFACTQSALDFLNREGLAENSFLSGDPMLDAFLYYQQRIGEQAPLLDSLDGEPMRCPTQYYYLTCHRAENASEQHLFEILSAMQALDAPTVYPVHPRNRDMAAHLRKQHGFDRVLMAKPVGYLASIALCCGAKKVVTDSGGVQREAFFAGKPCVTVLDFVVWPETMAGGCNQLARPARRDILQKLEHDPIWPADYSPFGDGTACEKICAILTGYEQDSDFVNGF